jgi:hypothetical protein
MDLPPRTLGKAREVDGLHRSSVLNQAFDRRQTWPQLLWTVFAHRSTYQLLRVICRISREVCPAGRSVGWRASKSKLSLETHHQKSPAWNLESHESLETAEGGGSFPSAAWANRAFNPPKVTHTEKAGQQKLPSYYLG